MQRGSGRNRLLAAASMVCGAAVVLLLIDGVADSFGSFLLGLVGLAGTGLGAWWAITERVPRRLYGIAIALVGLVLIAGALRDITSDGHFLLIVVLGVAAVVCARLAVAQTLHDIDLAGSLPVLRPQHPVLICNPKSGGGKVEQFDIVGRARAMGVEVVELQPGDDLAGLARDAVQRGADCLGMAGGDGSQALVASVAIEAGIPFVCISAGTRNHFAADLGLDRSDPASGLAAFQHGVVRDVDYGLVGDRLFVNNVSLGIYASIVEQAGYRNAKLATALQTLPTVVGPDGKPFDLEFDAPDGRSVNGALLVMVSNNPYVLQLGPYLAQRRSLTTGRLGVVAVSAEAGEGAQELVASIAEGLVGSDPRMFTFTAPTFEVRSQAATVAAGVDGEAITVDAPLHFRIVPKGLQLLVPPDTLTVTASKRYREFGVRGLWDIARGRRPHIEDVLH